MRAFRFLTSLVACAALFSPVLLASSAGAGTHSFGGRFTANRSRVAQVPVVGLTPGGSIAGCNGLTFMTGAGPAGAVTVLPPPGMQLANERGPSKRDLGCLPAKNGLMVVTPAPGTAPVAGGAFTLPLAAFYQMNPGMLNAIGLPPPPSGFVQFATSNIVSGPPDPRAESPGGTMLVGCVGVGGTQTCANQAPVGAFKKGPRLGATGSGRAGLMFAWCQPDPALGTMGAPGCAVIGGGLGGVKGIIKYFGTATAFSGTLGYITEGVATGGLARLGAGGVLNIDPFPPGRNSQPTGRGYADYNTDALLGGIPFTKFMVMDVTTNPVLGKQKLITTVGMAGVMGVSAVAHQWGFPLTEKTVLVRNTGTIIGGAHNTTFTAKGYDCVNARGDGMGGCGAATGMGYRNISLVAGSLGVAVFPPPIGTIPTVNLASLYMPEPGATLQLLAGGIGLLGIAAWRSRRVR